MIAMASAGLLTMLNFLDQIDVIRPRDDRLIDCGEVGDDHQQGQQGKRPCRRINKARRHSRMPCQGSGENRDGKESDTEAHNIAALPVEIS